MQFLRTLARRAVRGPFAVSYAPAPLAVVASLVLSGLVLNGCTSVKLPVEWEVWPEKAATPRRLPTPAPNPAQQTSHAPSIQRVVRPPEYGTLAPYTSPALKPPTFGAMPQYKSPAVTLPGIKIAILVPLSGPSANVGTALLDAAQVALFDVGDERLTLLPKDTKGTPEGAAQAADAAISEGAELILGPLFSQSVAAAAPAARRRGINMVAFSTDRTVAGNGVYLFGFLPREQVDRVIGYAVGQGLTRFAALVPETPYGIAILDALNQAALARGAEIVQVETYPNTGESPHEAVRRLANYELRHQALVEERKLLKGLGDDASKANLKSLEGLETLGELDYDAVIIPEGGDRLRSVALLLPYYDIDPSKIRFIGTGLWDDETIGREPALVGGWFAAVPPTLSKTFTDRYAQVYGARPPRVASIAYDAVALAALLAGETSYRGEARFGASKLTAATGFAGANGLFRLNADGLTERGLAVVEVRRDGTRVIDPPSDTFPPPPSAPPPAAANDPMLDPYGWQTTESGWPAP